jgi:hypothetical protein
MSQAPGPWTYKAQGDANFYTILDRPQHWLAAVQLNGELHTDQQEAIMPQLTAAPAMYEVVCQLLEWADKPARERRIGLGPILERALRAKAQAESKGGA